jgi:fatty acid desaturase
LAKTSIEANFQAQQRREEKIMSATTQAKTMAAPEKTDGMRAAEITLAIKEADNKWRQRLPILYYQSALGMFFLVASIAIFFVAGKAWLDGQIHWVPMVAINAFCLAVIREIEHDCVHDLYFPKNKNVQNLMMLAVWPMLGNVPHPWYRRELHMVHHRNSGRKRDLEERMIGMGLPMGFERIFTMLDAPLGIQFRRSELKTIPFYNKRDLNAASIPVTKVWYLIALSYLALKFVVVPAATLMGWTDPETMGPMTAKMLHVYAELAKPFTIWIFPGWFQTWSRQILSSWMHYYLDFGSKLHEVQVLNAWCFGVFNFFSCNFGNTHVIHHFNEKQTFYLRELVKNDVLPVCKKHGVRFNDYGAILRCNHFKKETPCRKEDLY